MFDSKVRGHVGAKLRLSPIPYRAGMLGVASPFPRQGFQQSWLAWVYVVGFSVEVTPPYFAWPLDFGRWRRWLTGHRNRGFFEARHRLLGTRCLVKNHCVYYYNVLSWVTAS